MEKNVVRAGVLSIQVCVPVGTRDEDIITFAESQNPCGTQNGWQIRREGSALQQGDPERIRCAKDDHNEHVTLDA